MSVLSCVCLAQERAVPEYTMKAAYLYNFAQLTDWPSVPLADRENFHLCVVGQEEVATAVQPLRGRIIDGRPLKLVLLTDATDVRQCDLLYIGEGNRILGNRLLNGLRDSKVLTVTDDQYLAHNGTMLFLLTEGNRLTFEVNLDAAKRAQINFSSKLLRLASRIRK